MAVAAVVSLLFMASHACRAQDGEVLCSAGSGGFGAESRAGVTVEVKAARDGALATRACEGTLSWNKNTLTIATMVPQLDLDLFDADLGIGVPIAAFQVKKSETDCCREYQIYSLNKPPRLLRTLTGGGFFSAADTDLDGRVEIWTNDAAAVRSFENLTILELDAPPAIVLRFEHGELLEVSSEFQAVYDKDIRRLGKDLDAEGLRNFKNSDGKLSPNSQLSAERLQQLRGVKAKVLEIVWGYLYSGREQQAWRSLAEMWPPGDIERVRAAIMNRRAHGISAQLDGVSAVVRGSRKKRARIFDAISESTESKPEVTPPQPIMLRRPPLLGIPDQDSSPSELLLELVVDCAGKVRSAEPARKATSLDSALVHAAAEWKFMPAFKGGQPVASRMRLAVSSRQ
jgi:hypothetical protein